MAPMILRRDTAPRPLLPETVKSRPALNLLLLLSCAIGSFGVFSPAYALGEKPMNLAASKPSTSRATEKNAICSIPLEKLSGENREKIAKLLSGPHIFRRLPVHVGPCDPNLYLFLLRHPDVVVGVWEELGISQLRMKQIGPEKFQTHEINGTAGTSEFLYQDPNLHLIWVEGEFNGPLLTKPVRGVSLLVLRTGYICEPNGRHYITSRLDTFTHIDNVGIEFITKTLQPLMGKVADNNFVQTSAFIGSLSRTAETNPRGVRRLAGKLHRVDPEIRREFGLLARRTAEKYDRLGQTERLAGKPILKNSME